VSLSRLAVPFIGCALLALVGSVAAKPPAKTTAAAPKLTKGVTLEGLDPEFARQLAPRPLAKDEANEIIKQGRGQIDSPKFNIKHLEPVQRAQILGAGDPAALPAALVFDARTPYHDDDNYLELLSNDGAVYLRPLRNYFYFMGGDAVMASRYTRPSAVIHFKAAANTRYLLECAVDGGPQTTFSAADSRAEYSVTTDDKATLLYVRDQVGGAENVVVQIAGDTPMWYLDGCELTASPR
jgi:hypothetical protein